MGKADTGRWPKDVGFRRSSCRVISVVWGLSRGPRMVCGLMTVATVMVVVTIFVVEVSMAISCMTRELLRFDCCVASGTALPISGLGLTHLEIPVDGNALQWLTVPQPARFAEAPNVKALLRHLCPQVPGKLVVSQARQSPCMGACD